MESPLSLVAGGTGLVGSHVIKVLSKKPGTQIILARSFESEIPQNAELQIINFDSLSSNKVQLKMILIMYISAWAKDFQHMS